MDVLPIVDLTTDWQTYSEMAQHATSKIPCGVVLSKDKEEIRDNCLEPLIEKMFDQFIQ